MATMNDCKNIRPLLVEYADGELGETQAWQVKLHVQSCAVCASIANDFAGTARLVSSLPSPKGPSANFEALLARRIADGCLAPKPLSPLGRVRLWWEEQAAHSRPVYRFAPAFVAVVVVLMATLPTGYLLTHPIRTVAGVSTPSPLPDTTKNLVASDPALTELWNEHTAFSAAQPLGDPATALNESRQD